jgi:hypothetical protein
VIQQSVAGYAIENFLMKSLGDFPQAKIPEKDIVARGAHSAVPMWAVVGQEKGPWNASELGRQLVAIISDVE